MKDSALNPFYDIVIVGAGITGLCIADQIRRYNSNLKVLVLEKSKAVGGRMATRRFLDARFDHGAQFIKHSKYSESLIALWTGMNLAVPFPTQRFKAVHGVLGMTSLSKNLGSLSPISLDIKVQSVKRELGHLRIDSDEGHVFNAKKVFLTSPLPQSLDILRFAGIQFERSLEEIGYNMAIVALIRLKQELPIPESYVQEFDQDIYSICSQKAKGLSEHPDYTIVFNDSWSRRHFELTEKDLENHCQIEIEKRFVNVMTTQIQVKKWRYSHPKITWPTPYHIIDQDIYLCGDAFGGPSLNGALESAFAVIEHLKSSEFSS